MNLRASTGSTGADDVIADVVAAYASRLPGAVRGVYVAGSYAEGLAVPASDIDLVVVLREGVNEELARQIADACASGSPIRLDLVPVTTVALAARFLALVPSFKYGRKVPVATPRVIRTLEEQQAVALGDQGGRSDLGLLVIHEATRRTHRPRDGA